MPRSVGTAAGQVGVHQGGEVDPRDGAQVVPQSEARIDLEQPQSPRGVTLEVELRDARKLQAREDVAPERRDVGRVGELEGGALAAFERPSPDLPAGELAHHLATGADVRVVALDPPLRSRDELLREQRQPGGGETRPQRRQVGRRVHAQGFRAAGHRVP